MNIYAQNILDRYKEPFYKDKSIEPTIIHKEANHSCGDVVEIKIELKDSKASNYSFSGNGCAISMASADMLGDLVKGASESDVLDISKADVFEMLGIEISLRRSKCALLSLLAIQNGILQKRGGGLRSWMDYN